MEVCRNCMMHLFFLSHSYFLRPERYPTLYGICYDIHIQQISTIAFVLTSVQDLRDSDKPKTKTLVNAFPSYIFYFSTNTQRVEFRMMQK